MIEDIKKSVLTILILSTVGGVLLGISLSTNNCITCLCLLPTVITCTHVLTDLFYTLDDLERRLYK